MRTAEGYRKTRKRFDEPGDAHELTFSCFRGLPLLSKPRTCQYLAEAIVKAKAALPFDIWAYVFMPEHVHLLVWPTEDWCTVSHILKAVKQSVARRAILYLKRNNPGGLRWLATGQNPSPYRFWQEGGGHDRNVRYVKALVAMAHYIHSNPVRRGLVEVPEEWEWSSARLWAGLGDGPVPIDFDSFPGGAPDTLKQV